MPQSSQRGRLCSSPALGASCFASTCFSVAYPSVYEPACATSIPRPIISHHENQHDRKFLTLTLHKITGALRATKNSGLQPAMDFLLEHSDDPIPDPSAQAQAAPSSVTGGDAPMDEDDEEDAAALRAVYGTGAGAAVAAAADVEAKVRSY